MVMTRTPDEIKNGLECCSNVNFVCNEECPYYKSLSEGEDCCLKKNADALALIQQLESKLECSQMTIDGLIATLLKCDTIIKQLQAERDAAVGRLKQIRDCERCKNYPIPMQNIPCLTCTQSNNSFEWRGVQREE